MWWYPGAVDFHDLIESSLSGRRRLGFTLMEVLVTVTIIVVLGAMTFPVLSLVQNRSRLAAAQQIVRQLAQCLETYRSIDQGGHRYPTPQSDRCLANRAPASGSSAVLELLQGFRIQFPRTSALDAQGRLIDPWGQPYRYTLTRPVVTDPASLFRWNWDEANGREQAWGKRWDAVSGAVANGPLPFPYVYSLGPKRAENVAKEWVLEEDAR